MTFYFCLASSQFIFPHINKYKKEIYKNRLTLLEIYGEIVPTIIFPLSFFLLNPNNRFERFFLCLFQSNHFCLKQLQSILISYNFFLVNSAIFLFINFTQINFSDAVFLSYQRLQILLFFIFNSPNFFFFFHCNYDQLLNLPQSEIHYKKAREKSFKEHRSSGPSEILLE